MVPTCGIEPHSTDSKSVFPPREIGAKVPRARFELALSRASVWRLLPLVYRGMIRKFAMVCVLRWRRGESNSPARWVSAFVVRPALRLLSSSVRDSNSSRAPCKGAAITRSLATAGRDGGSRTLAAGRMKAAPRLESSRWLRARESRPVDSAHETKSASPPAPRPLREESNFRNLRS